MRRILPNVFRIGLLLALLGLAGRLFLETQGSALLVLGLAVLMMASFIGAFLPSSAPPNGLSPDYLRDLLAPKIAGVAGAFTLVGVLFKLMFWPGYATNLMAGVPMLVAATLLLVPRYLNAGAHPLQGLAQRSAVLSLAALLVWVVPAPAMARFIYRHQPERAEKLIGVLEHPHDPAYQQAWADFNKQQGADNN